MITKSDFVAEPVEESLSTCQDLVHSRSLMKTSEDPSGMRALCQDMAKVVLGLKPHGAQRDPSKEIVVSHVV